MTIPGEGLVAEEDVDGAGVGHLAGVILLVLHAPCGLPSLFTGEVPLVAVRRHEVCASYEPVGIVQ